MMKTECLDPYIDNTNWNASNCLWCTGYSPRRYRSGLNLLIHKQSNDNRVDRLRPILLFDLEANMLARRQCNKQRNVTELPQNNMEAEKEGS
eukprot:12141955-Ditylum_brightwellii.AAC.2